MECVAKTRSVADAIAARDVDTAMATRGGSFTPSYGLLRTIVQARPHRPDPGQRSLRLALLHAGGTAPGMNAAVRVAVRIGMDRGHTVLAVRNGFRGLVDGTIDEMDWMTVSGWVSRPGAELGTSRFVPATDDLPLIAAQLRSHRIDGLLAIGGWAGYVAAHRMASHAGEHVDVAVPIVCVPASINNDLPASDMSIGADTALNSIVSDVDKIKASAVGSHRCFVVVVMGRDCGFLALMGGVATGAEQVYVPEEGISLQRLHDDIEALSAGFARRKRLGLVIRGEGADPVFTTDFVRSMLAHESGGHFDVRSAVLGHVQQGGVRSPFDRIQATRLASAGVDHLIAQALAEHPTSAMVGLRHGRVVFTDLEDFPDLVEEGVQRPRSREWWMALRPLADIMAMAPR
jgi:6-phosphofructokinase 1